MNNIVNKKGSQYENLNYYFLSLKYIFTMKMPTTITKKPSNHQ